MPTAAREVVLLSSSPPHIPDSDIISTPPHLRNPPSPSPPPVPQSPLPSPHSSSSLPSPTVLFKRPALHGLKSGSRAAPIPDGITLGFASAGALVKERVLSLDADVGEESGVGRSKRKEAAKSTSGRTKPAKRAARKAVEEGDEAIPKKPRKSRKKDEREHVPRVVEIVEENVLPEGSGQRETTSGVEDTGVAKGNQDAAAVDSGAAEKPKGRKTRANLNNSELIRNVLGLDPIVELPQSESRRGGAVEKLRRRKANNDPAQPPASPVESGTSAKPSRHDPALDEALQDQAANPKKTAEKKPRARKTKKPDDALVEPQELAETAKAPKPRKRQTTTRKSTKTVSDHFSPDNLVDTAAPKMSLSVPVNNPPEPLDLSPALMRRRSWTPPKDTKSSPNGHDPVEPVDLCENPSEKTPVAVGSKPSFAELLDAFGYEGQRAGSEALASRTESGEAFTKRRRLEPIEKPNQPAEVSIPEPCDMPSENINKPDKAPKKKPRTITDLATAAYRPVAPAEISEPLNPPIAPTVSAFFAPQADSMPDADRPDAPEAEKPKRTGRSKNPTKKAESKPKKPTAKSKKAVKLAAEKLLSPESASLRMDRQDILFGTSSQLAREESPTFVRDLQQAIRDSEMLGSQIDNLETLHLKPAVSGSGLSLIGQRKGLWAAASRDHEDGILEQEKSANQDSERDVFVDDGMDFVPEVPEEVPSVTQHQATATCIDANEQATQESGTAELANCSTDDLPEAPSMSLGDGDDFERVPSAQPVQPSSDYIDIDEFDHDQQLSHRSLSLTWPSSHSTSHSSPNARRTALQQLGTRPNIPLLPQSISDVSSNLGKAMFATKAASRSKKAVAAAEKSPTKRPVGRPRKVAASDDGVSQDSVGETSIAPVTSPSKRPRGPKSNAAVAEKVKSPSKGPKGKARSTSTAALLATPKKQKSKKKAAAKEEWPDIDEIEDSQEETSPSPPRRTKAATAHPPLTLSLSQEERNTADAFEGPTVPVPGSTARKSTERVPHYYLEAVFPKITTVVKACRPSDNPSQPSWHEKMLLYDPIVVEDLAEWLNGQGVQVGVLLPVAESRRGRKKREEAEAEGILMEKPTSKKMQELPDWAVQRWCEENSICCMFKESPWTKGRKKRAKR
ncbi:structure-specific endonuclease subunit slx4 [Diplodia corticola]|uniref:Structure-specific endonuclease subunit SLX4 n=1 Tax=Diplodia corticola TaxID=236234 RepID=A0A1J9R7W6_9PEZI|nr:structure-specific endonuclease subunit slx4 [Diplodia corticola]OJD36688.1 structure-specific endonuclease subunit slx4 [Diplodia corticola]